MKSDKEIAKMVKEIVNTFTELNGTSFAGIKEYTNSNGETANHVVNVGFNYGNAVDKDLAALQALTASQMQEIADNVTPLTLGKFDDITSRIDVKLVVEEMINSFVKNKNKETASNSSKGQTDAYIHITSGIKLHVESGEIYIYALGISKKVLVKGTYKDVNHGTKWYIQNEIKNYCKFSTAKYKNFKITKDKFTKVNISGESYSIE